MNIALIGYGKMGREIEQIALERGHTILFKIDVDNKDVLTAEEFKQVDVAIEFTSPHSAVDNVKVCLAAGVPVVIGSTGWYNQLPEVKKYCEEHTGGMFYASNFSLGVNLFFELNKKLAQLMANAEGYEVGMLEVHHTQKVDAPSGTAITLAEGLFENYPRKTKWVSQVADQPTEELLGEEVLPILSLRKDPAPGTHMVEYRSASDRIVITHEAFNRRGFATGAVLAAEYLQGKKGIYTMADLLKL
ncbi:MAG: 4-hydroxy-tetrahydrodipicolinate reductase [Sphingobacteriales bacterium JAD_PAG50586_3]|nr:MAG: 4-hydroxy-tetrahydrodipicolinate reductase [Sphingobacteriales bacterium JAD_PAG50586_3]